MRHMHLQRTSARSPVAYRRISVAVPVEPQNELEELGHFLLFGAMICFAVGAIARAL